MRTVSIMGDSISTFSGCNPEGFAVFYDGARQLATGVTDPSMTWWSLLAGRLGARVLANASYSGSMVQGAGFPAAVAPERACALLGPNGERPDDVVIFIGINDYGWGSPEAQAAGRSAATPPCLDLSRVPPATAGLAPANAAERFGAAYARMLANVREVAPSARVWCCSLVPGRAAEADRPTFAWNLRGVPLARYNEQIARAAEREGARYADACAYGLDYEASDGTHPTALGMRQLAALFAAAIEGEKGPDPAPFGGDARPDASPWASRVLCPGRACVGCPHARGTGNAWYCVCEREAVPDEASGSNG